MRSEILLQGARLFDGDEALPPGTCLLIEGDRIAALAPHAHFAGYTGPRADLGGHTVLPGLIDCHAHLTLSGDLDGFAGSLDRFSRAGLQQRALENAQACLAGGVTALRDCGGVDHVEIAVRDLCESGAAVGPTIRVAGRCICVTGGTNFLVARIADGTDQIEKAVREQAAAGADCIKLMATGGVLTPGTGVDDAQYTQAELEAGVAMARRLGRPVASHAIGATGILNAARAGVDSIEHGVFLTDESIAEMLRRGIYLVPTLAAITHILEHLEAGFSAEVVDKAHRVADSVQRSVRSFHAAGGRIAMGADTGTPFNPHGSNARELLYMVRAGMPATDALRSATSHAADLLRLPTRGRLRAGHFADLLVTAGDPLADIAFAALREHHRAVIKAGRCVAGRL